MARRPKLTAPTPDELAEVEVPAGRPSPSIAPIAQIAAEAARAPHAPLGPDAQDAAAWREAEAEGRVMRSIDLARIEEGWIARDRAALEPEAMEELKGSIRASGLRLPLEVCAIGDGRYGLLSGYRRLMALRALAAEGGASAAPCLVTPASSLGTRYARMVEENEIRADLSPYERGRVAVVAAGQGAYEGIEAAVNALFAQASKAKRSKIRAFALVHEELGDLMRHGPALPERSGLALAAAIRGGFAAKLRAALEAAEESGASETAAGEWRALAGALADADGAKGAGGRPSAPVRDLGHGVSAKAGKGRLELTGLTQTQSEALMERISDWLGET